jgi:cell division protein FtsN
MKASTDKKQMPRKNIFDAGEDDLEMTEMNILPDDSEFNIEPLDNYHYIEESLEDLVEEQGSEKSEENPSNQQTRTSDLDEERLSATHSESDSSEIMPPKYEQIQFVQAAKDITTHFYVDYSNFIPPAKKSLNKPAIDIICGEQAAIANTGVDASEHHVVNPNFTASTTNPVDSDAMQLAHEELIVAEHAPGSDLETTDYKEAIANLAALEETMAEINNQEQSVERSSSIADDSGMTIAVLSEFKARQENLNTQYKKMIQASANSVKKATVITCAALIFSFAALLICLSLAIMLSRAQSEITGLLDTVASLKDDVERISLKISAVSVNEASPDEQMENNQDLSLKDQSRIPAQDEIKQDASNDADLPGASAPLLEMNKEINSATLSPVKPIITGNSVEVSKIRTNDPEVKPKVAIGRQTEKSVVAALAIDKSPVKSGGSERKAITQKKELADEKKIADSRLKTEKVDSDKAAIDKSKAVSEIWIVKVDSYKNEEVAKNKAAMLGKKGIHVKVKKMTDKKNQLWYRLQFGHFKSREEATQFAEKLKQTHNLGSVSVTR